MLESTSREKVLKKIRNALTRKVANPFPHIDLDSSVHIQPVESPEINFAHSFTANGGHFVFCEHEAALLSNLTSFVGELALKNIFTADEKIAGYLQKAGIHFSFDEKTLTNGDVSFTPCEALIARTGSVLVSSMQKGGRKSVVASPVHAVIGYTSQIVPDIKDALIKVRNAYKGQFPSMVSFLSGPSRTADIEKTLVTGAHGPKAIYVFLLDDAAASSI
jgi:L-lactate dehydrogenase complex protein LldG